MVLDPFGGSNMTGFVAQKLSRQWITFEINEEYLKGSQFRFPELGELSNSLAVEDQLKQTSVVQERLL